MAICPCESQVWSWIGAGVLVASSSRLGRGRNPDLFGSVPLCHAAMAISVLSVLMASLLDGGIGRSGNGSTVEEIRGMTSEMLLREVIDIPESVHSGDFKVNLAET